MMAYRKNFAVAIKQNGKILREIGEVVKLPFGAEYSILLKNKDSRKAVAKVEIDGEDVLSGNGIIVEPHESVELKGFMKGATVRNRFKFIHKTKQISNYRGDRIDDGLVSVEFWFEKEEDLKVTPWPAKPTPNIYGGGLWEHQAYYTNNVVGCTLGASNSVGVTKCSTPIDDNGLTVKGSKTSQSFVYGNTDTLEASSTVITIRLSGFSQSTKKPVKKALSVNTRITCVTCGKKSKSSAIYCGRCGTYIQ